MGHSPLPKHFHNWEGMGPEGRPIPPPHAHLGASGISTPPILNSWVAYATGVATCPRYGFR